MSEAKKHHDQVLLVECNLDDMTGEELGYALERVLSEGALDAWFTPIYMKKNRPGVVLSVLCHPEDGQGLCTLLLRETSTLGVRYRMMDREVAERKIVNASTPWGLVRCKLKILAGRVISIKPEYADCAQIAQNHDLPLREVSEVAREAVKRLQKK